MSRLRRAALAAMLFSAVATHAFAASPSDSFDPANRIRQIINVIKRVLLPIRQDEPQIPHP